MDNFGEILKKTRLEKNIDIETVEQETTIARHYITALEEEKLSVIPGEPYIIGFLRNYASYLELDADHLVALYKAARMQEAPVPEGLIARHRPKLLIPVIILIALLLAGAFCVWYFLLGGPVSSDAGSPAAAPAQTAEYTLGSEPLERRLYKGDVVLIPAGTEGPVPVTVESTLSLLALSTPAGTLYVELGEELELNIDGEMGGDIVVFVSDISRTDESLGAEVRIFQKHAEPEYGSGVDMDAIPAESAEGGGYTVILQDTRAYPFTLNLTCRSGCVFRYKTDNSEPVEDYYTNGDQLTVQAKNRMRLWISNNAAVKLQVLADGKTYDLEMGRGGQIIAEDIKWIRDTDGMYKLVVANID